MPFKVIPFTPYLLPDSLHIFQLMFSINFSDFTASISNFIPQDLNLTKSCFQMLTSQQLPRSIYVFLSVPTSEVFRDLHDLT